MIPFPVAFFQNPFPTPFMWLDASQLTGLSDGDAVESWTDFSGNGHHGFQTTLNRQPIYKTNIIAGHPVLRFDGVNDHFRLPNALRFNRPVTIVAVHQIRGNSNHLTFGIGTILATGVFVGSIAGWGMAFDSINNRLVGQIRHNATVVTPGKQGYSLFTPILQSTVVSETDISLYVDGALADSLPHNVNAVPNAWSASIGTRYKTNSNFNFLYNGDIAEIFVFPKALNASERQQVDNYLSQKYNIPNIPNIPYEAESIALFTRMSALGEYPNTTRKGIINTFILAEKNAGNWSKYDCLWFLAAHAAGSARLNWIKDAHNPTVVGTVAFVTDKGYTGGGSNTSNFLNTNFSATQGINFQQNNCSLGGYSLTNQQGSGMIGARITSAPTFQSTVVPRTTSNTIFGRIHSPTTSTSIATANSDSIGLSILARTSGTDIKIIKNGTTLVSITNSNSGPAENVNFYLCGSNNGNTAVDQFTGQMAFGFVASGDLDYTAQHTNITNYLTSIGAL
ncbi:MAG: hypothetical protein H0X63_00055 [Flavobacteriales bacterium]|nr:hypothetical protein [Flavobacteriales bacterium]